MRNMHIKCIRLDIVFIDTCIKLVRAYEHAPVRSNLSTRYSLRGGTNWKSGL